MKSIYVSVIIPTINRPTDLKNCLTGLQQQDDLKDLQLDFEVIVVNDHSQSTFMQLYRETISAFPSLTLRFLELPASLKGAANARNFGVSYAKGEIIAFLDDDAIPHPDWLFNLTNYFRSFPEISALTGCIEAIELHHPLSIFRQNFYNNRFQRLTQPEYSDSIRRRFDLNTPQQFFLADYLSGGNSAVRANALSEHRNFDPNFVMMHDKDLALRLLRSKHICIYASDVIIKHAHTKSTYDAVSKSFMSGRMNFHLHRVHDGFLPPYSVDLSRPFNIIKNSRNLINSLGPRGWVLPPTLVVMEYLNQLGYVFESTRWAGQRVVDEPTIPAIETVETKSPD